jgi:hypothetical protein
VDIIADGRKAAANYTEVANFSALPSAASANGLTYLAKSGQGFYFINRKPAGLYTSDGANWNYAADSTEAYFQEPLAWANITSKPATFLPSAHTHPPQGSYFPSGW